MLRINKDEYANDENNKYGRYLGVGVRRHMPQNTDRAHKKYL
jgi:hypothetical protein